MRCPLLIPPVSLELQLTATSFHRELRKIPLKKSTLSADIKIEGCLPKIMR